MNKYVSEELQEISLKKGINNYTKVVFLIIIFILIITFLSFLIKYPDKITGNVYIVSENQTSEIISPYDGVIKVLVKDKEYVKKHDIIAVILNPANHTDVIQLKEMLNTLDFDDITSLEKTFKYNPKLKLGELEKNYHAFLLALFEYENILKINLSEQKIRNLQQKINRNKKVILSEKKIVKYSTEKSKILRKKHLIDSILYKDEVLLKQDLDRSKIDFLNSEEKKQSIINDNQKLLHLNSELLDQISLLKKENYIQMLAAIFNIKKKYFELKTMIDFWEHNYVITSPFNGIIEYHHPFLSSGIYVKKNTSLFVLLPNPKNFYGKGIIKASGYGKISKKDTVIIKLKDFPYKEYGYIKGIIKNKSKVYQDSIYYLNINLPFGLTTQNNYTIDFTYNMPGTIECITKKTSLIERVFSEVSSYY